MSHVSHINDSCLTCKGVMSPTWLSHVFHVSKCTVFVSQRANTHSHIHTHTHAHTHTRQTHTHTLTHTPYEWVMSHIWMSHVSHMNESCLTQYLYLNGNRLRGTIPAELGKLSKLQHLGLWTNSLEVYLHMWDMTHSYARHGAFTRKNFMCETWLICMSDLILSLPSCVRRDSLICETWFIYTWDMTHSYVRHDAFIWESFMCETWLIHVWDMTHSHALPSCVRHDLFICETWLIHMWDMTHPLPVRYNTVQYQRYSMPEPFICETWLLRTWSPLD